MAWGLLDRQVMGIWTVRPCMGSFFSPSLLLGSQRRCYKLLLWVGPEAWFSTYSLMLPSELKSTNSCIGTCSLDRNDFCGPFDSLDSYFSFHFDLGITCLSWQLLMLLVIKNPPYLVAFVGEGDLNNINTHSKHRHVFKKNNLCRLVIW